MVPGSHHDTFTEVLVLRVFMNASDTDVGGSTCNSADPDSSNKRLH